MRSNHVNVRITGKLQDHLKQQISNKGLYESASEYVRDLIRRDMKDGNQAWEWLAKELEPGLRDNEQAYIEVTASDVIKRNKKDR